jgi:hypothetical protein
MSTSLISGISFIVQFPAGSSGFRCRGFSYALLPRSVFLIVEGAEPADQSVAVDVGVEICRQLANLPGMVESQPMPCRSTISSPASCHALSNPDCLKIYLRISQAGGSISSYGPNAFDSVWMNPVINDGTWRILLAMPQATPVHDTWLLSKAMFPLGCHWDEWNACQWKGSPFEVIPSALALSGLTPEENRVFISYIRRETTDLADQVFERLTWAGFDVFLDRCSVPIGAKFQERLMQDIDDKAVVILLHSHGVAQKTSQWVEQEIARIKQYRLGLIVLRIPDPLNAGSLPPLRPDIDPDSVLDLSAADLTSSGPMSEPMELTPTALQTVLDLTREVHARALVRRRRELIDALGVELVAAKKNFQILPAGDIACGGAPTIATISPRPPDLEDYCDLHSRVSIGPAKRGVCISPTPFVVLKRKAAIEWLGTLSHMEHIDQEGIRDFVKNKIV